MRRVFVDTNVLLAATDRGRPLYGPARVVLDDWPNQGNALYLSGQVLREYLVVATRPRDVNGLALPNTDAAANAAAISERCVVLDEDARVSAELRRLVGRGAAAGRRIHDANIVATMRVHGVERFVTANVTDFESLAGEFEAVPLSAV